MTWTLFGRIALFANLALSLMFACWGFGLYSLRVNWTSKKIGDREGEYARLAAETDRLQGSRPRVDGLWLEASRGVKRLETLRPEKQQWYKQQIDVLKTGDAKQKILDIDFEQGQIKIDLKTGRPVMKLVTGRPVFRSILICPCSKSMSRIFWFASPVLRTSICCLYHCCFSGRSVSKRFTPRLASSQSPSTRGRDPCNLSVSAASLPYSPSRSPIFLDVQLTRRL